MVSELGAIQRVVGDVLIPEVRAQQGALPTMDDTLPVALELYYTAFSMKPAYRQAGIVVARRYAARMGLEPDDIEALAAAKIAAAIQDARSGDHDV